MKKLEIQTGKNNTVLRTKSDAVKPNELRQLADFINTMLKYVKDPKNGGVGLAAPQVGINKRIIVVSLMKNYDDENYKTIAMINPEILEHSDSTAIDVEWCLSVPGESGDVERYVGIKVQFLDPKGTKYLLVLSELSARIVQHEIDHLDGVLFTDKIIQKEPKSKKAF